MPTMSAEAVGRHMPPVVTLDDLAAMMTADGHHRYEISPEGVLSIMPPPGYAHAIIATRLMGWLLAAGIPAERIAQAVGLRIAGRAGGEGGRIPDLIVWSQAQADGVWLPVTDVLLVVEIVSPSSEGVDLVTKRREYADAGIPQYWTVDQDAPQTVTMHRLHGGEYRPQATMPLTCGIETRSRAATAPAASWPSESDVGARPRGRAAPRGRTLVEPERVHDRRAALLDRPHRSGQQPLNNPPRHQFAEHPDVGEPVGEHARVAPRSGDRAPSSGTARPIRRLRPGQPPGIPTPHPRRPPGGSRNASSAQHERARERIGGANASPDEPLDLGCQRLIAG